MGGRPKADQSSCMSVSTAPTRRITAASLGKMPTFVHQRADRRGDVASWSTMARDKRVLVVWALVGQDDLRWRRGLTQRAEVEPCRQLDV